MRVEPVELAGDGRFGAVFLPDEPDEPDEGVVFFGVGLLGPGFAEPPEAGFADLAGGFFAAGLAAGFVAAFQPVPQTKQDASDSRLFVSHLVQRQSAAGLAGDGRLAAGRGALLRGRGAAGAEAGARRVLPQIVQAFSAGLLKVSQSAQRQFAVAATPVVPFFVTRAGSPRLSRRRS
ncbi:hypothetical protein [Streptomyces colonosanans]|uniref:Uncharacterized protein n=1 Tax=Streptomyces colonosanans TaxID=1428652 RepID=A0A1S2Q644_9ACTN|nr:hypothetical protein [Streptomyces colonosanans]OIK00695.1 hypothetical protein BIV24_02900 [Streptomyces colonosanans]